MGNSTTNTLASTERVIPVIKLEKGDIVEITWKDSHAIYGWHELEDLTPSLIVSTGYILKEDDDYIVIVSSNSDSGNHFTALSIPRGCIRRTDILKRAESVETQKLNDGRALHREFGQVENSFSTAVSQDAEHFTEVEPVLA